MSTFLKSLIVVVCGCIFADYCFAQNRAVNKEMSVQLYSVKDLIGNPDLYAANHEKVLKAIAEMGYTGIEAACYDNGKLYGVTPEEFKADLEEAGLKVISSHIGKGLSSEEVASGDFTESLKWWDTAIAAHKAAGMEYIVCPYLHVPQTLKELKAYCYYYDEIGRRCKEAGMKFGYHNHSHEFSLVEGTAMLDYMLQNTDPELVFFQLDVYWATNANASPVEYFNKYPGRWKVLHIKDIKAIGKSGLVGFDAIFNNYETAGMLEYVVEIENCPNETALDVLRESAEYLKSSPFVKAKY